MNFKANKIILFCNRRLTQQISHNWGNSQYVQNLLRLANLQAQNQQLSTIDIKLITNYILYSLGNYYRGNMIFIFQILVAFLYLITPVDIVNDFIPAIGYVDDLLLFSMILEVFDNELQLFKQKHRQQLEIKYLEVDMKVIEGFTIKPIDAIDLIIKERKLESIDGEQLINDAIINATNIELDDVIYFDTNEIIKYELTNYLLKQRTQPVLIDEELVEQLVQVPNVVSKKDIEYFLTNIDELMASELTEIEAEKKSLFKGYNFKVKYDEDKLVTSPLIKFIQVDSEYTQQKQVLVKYRSIPEERLNYEHIVEMIDLLAQKHIFEKTIVEFEIVLAKTKIVITYNFLTTEISYFVNNGAICALDEQLAIICQIIKDRIN